MREFIISTETNSDMPESFLKENDILVIPHYYTVEDTEYGIGAENGELTVSQFYDEMKAGKKVGTMASNPAVILEKFEEVAKQGKDILHISFSSQLSSGCQNIINGANEIMEEHPDMKIVVVDTLSATLGEGVLMQLAVNLRKEGKTMDEVAQALKDVLPHINILLTVDNLDYLYRGGRLSKTSAVLGTMINLKPIIEVTEAGGLSVFEKVRGRKKTYATMLKAMEDRIGNYMDKQIFIGIMHGDVEEDAIAFKAMIEEKFGFKNFVIAPIGPSIGAHTGPGTLGVMFLGEKRA